MTKIILRRLTNDSERDKYEYLISCTKQGIEITTPLKDNATVFNNGEDVRVTSKDWQAVRYTKKRNA